MYLDVVLHDTATSKALSASYLSRPRLDKPLGPPCISSIVMSCDDVSFTRMASARRSVEDSWDCHCCHINRRCGKVHKHPFDNRGISQMQHEGQQKCYQMHKFTAICTSIPLRGGTWSVVWVNSNTAHCLTRGTSARRSMRGSRVVVRSLMLQQGAQAHL